MKYTLATLLFMLSGTLVWAHSKTHTTIPADGAVLNAAPEVIELRFNAAIRLTRVEAVNADGARQDIELTDYSEFSDSFTLTAPVLRAGAYDIEWRGLGQDGHAMTGGFGFTVE